MLTLHNPVKKAEEVATVEFAFKALVLKGVRGLICDQVQVMGSICIKLVGHHLSMTVFGNHITSNDPVISGSTQKFPYHFRPFTGYRVSVVYGRLRKGMAYTKLYVNGRVAGTKFFASSYPGRLGRTFVGAMQGNRNSYFQGFIDDLRIWNIPRMAWQIKSDYNKHAVGVERGLIAYFPMDVPDRKIQSLGVSAWTMDVKGAAYAQPFYLGRRHPA